MVVISYMVILCSSLVFQVFLFHALTTLFNPIVFSHNFIFLQNNKVMAEDNWIEKGCECMEKEDLKHQR